MEWCIKTCSPPCFHALVDGNIFVHGSHDTFFPSLLFPWNKRWNICCFCAFHPLPIFPSSFLQTKHSVSDGLYFKYLGHIGILVINMRRKDTMVKVHTLDKHQVTRKKTNQKLLFSPLSHTLKLFSLMVDFQPIPPLMTKFVWILLYLILQLNQVEV